MHWVETDGKVEIDTPLPTTWTEVMGSDEKLRLFTPCIDQMKRIMEIKGYTLPSDMLKRLFIVNQEIFDSAIESSQMPFLKSAIGMALPNRNALISEPALKKILPSKEYIDLFMQIVGTHELWHTLDYREFWLNGVDLTKPVEEIELYKQQRRWGIYTAPPRTQPILNGIGALMEGFTEYRTREVIRALYPWINYYEFGSYLDQLETIDYLVLFMGNDQVFYDASFTSAGFAPMVRSIKKTYWDALI